MKKSRIEEAALRVLKAGGIDIRKIPRKVTNEEVASLPLRRQPFLYSSGNWGPGYVMIKGLVGRKRTMKFLVRELAKALVEKGCKIDFVAGNVSGGMIPGWELSEKLEVLTKRSQPLPFVYIRESRKKGGHKELVTGIANNPEIPYGSSGIVVEELVNFAETTCNGAVALRKAGYVAEQAATILFYDNPVAAKNLEEHGIKMTYLFTLRELLDVVQEHGVFPADVIDDYRNFLNDPLAWQAERGLVPIKEGGTK